jgi:hypothetical protein
VADRPLERVRNKTGEDRTIRSLGEEGWPVNRTVGVDEVLQLPDDLALRLAEQPGWEFEGNEGAARRRVAKRTAADEDAAPDAGDAPAEQDGE